MHKVVPCEKVNKERKKEIAKCIVEYVWTIFISTVASVIAVILATK